MTPDFIHNEIISPTAVDECLKIFEKNSHRHEAGTTAAGINDKYKKSTELCLKLDELENIPTYLNELNEILENYFEKYQILDAHEGIGYVDGINIQKYEPGEGFFYPHCERMDNKRSNRVLVFTTYLTDTKNAGTNFIYLNWNSECKKGSTLIFPTDFPFTHKGIISYTEPKYIVTGWLGFRPKENNL